MNLLHPLILTLGALSVAIPIAIHLLMRRRRQPVMWGAMRFVLEAYRQTRRRLLLQRWLLLISRCLLVLLAGILLARPLLGTAAGSSSSTPRRLHLVIDNAIASSVAAQTKGRSALDQRLTEARQLIDALSESTGDEVSILLTASPPQQLLWPASRNLAGAKALLDTIKPADSAPDLRWALRLIASGFDPNADASRIQSVALLSDFTVASADLASAPPALPSSFRVIVPAPSKPAPLNVGVASITTSGSLLLTDAAASSAAATVALVRSGELVRESSVTTLRLSLSRPDAPSTSPAAADIPTVTVPVRWSIGQRTAQASIPLDQLLVALPPALATSSDGQLVLTAAIDSDALAADNIARKPLQLRTTLRVGLITEPSIPPGPRAADTDAFSPGQWLAAALRPTDQAAIEITELDPAALDPARLTPLDAIIITTPQRLSEQGWSRIAAHVRRGGLLILTPQSDLDAQAWPDALKAALPLPFNAARAPIDLTNDSARLLPQGPSADQNDQTDLLRAVRSELSELTRSVRVSRVLPITPAAETTPSASNSPTSSTEFTPPPAPILNPAPLTTLLQLSTGRPFVVLITPTASPLSTNNPAAAPSSSATGSVIIITAALSSRWTDLPAKPLMVPLMQELIRQGVARSRPPLVTIAGAPLTIPARLGELRSLPTNTLIALDPTTNQPTTPLRGAALLLASDTRNQPLALLAINPDAQAARLDSPDPAALRSWLTAITARADAPGTPPSYLKPAADAIAPGFDPTDARSPTDLLATSTQGTPLSSIWLLALVALALIELALARWASVPVTFGPVGSPAPNSKTNSNTPSSARSSTTSNNEGATA